MPQKPRRDPLSDLERKAYRGMVAEHMRVFPDSTMDGEYLSVMARAVVATLTTGSASGRRLRIDPKRLPDPGSHPDRIRALARRIEDSFHTMPNGWKRAGEEKTHE